MGMWAWIVGLGWSYGRIRMWAWAMGLGWAYGRISAQLGLIVDVVGMLAEALNGKKWVLVEDFI